MRTALLPTSCQTHVVGTWLKYYERWQDEIDHLEVHVNQSNHGVALKEMVPKARGSYLMLIEDDGIIFKPGFVNRCFRWIETGEYDAVGSPRMSCHPELADAAKKRYNLDYSGFGDRGPHWWPNFFFVKKKLLMKTDLHFWSKGWNKGDYIKELDHTVQAETIMGDTFVWTSIQLRKLGIKVKEIPQHHSALTDLADYKNKTGLWSGGVNRIHLGSITGSVTPLLPEQKKVKATVAELEKKLMWHMFCGKEMEKSLVDYGVDPDRVMKLYRAYEELLA
jgi:hypothetical protein